MHGAHMPSNSAAATPMPGAPMAGMPAPGAGTREPTASPRRTAESPTHAAPLVVRVSLVIGFFTFAGTIVVGLVGGGFRAVVLRGMAAAFFGFLVGIVSLGIGWSFLQDLARRRKVQSNHEQKGARI